MGNMSNIIKNVGKGIGKGVGKAAYYSLSTVSAAISAMWETTGTRGHFREALDDCTDSELIEINIKQSGEDGDYEIYKISKSLLLERNYQYNETTNKWKKVER